MSHDWPILLAICQSRVLRGQRDSKKEESPCRCMKRQRPYHSLSRQVVSCHVMLCYIVSCRAVRALVFRFLLQAIRREEKRREIWKGFASIAFSVFSSQLPVDTHIHNKIRITGFVFLVCIVFSLVAWDIMAKTLSYEVNENILCYHGPLIYEAKASHVYESAHGKKFSG